jgi:hypothetical protein
MILYSNENMAIPRKPVRAKPSGIETERYTAELCGMLSSGCLLRPRDRQCWRSLVAANERRTGPAQKGGGEGGGEEVAPVAGEAMTRIVTSTYRYKRPPRKRKPVLIEVPAIVTPRKRAVLPTDEPKLPPPAAPPPANDDWPAETAPLPAARKKSAIVTPSKRGRRPKPEPEIDADAEARVQAFLARMVRPPCTPCSC